MSRKPKWIVTLAASTALATIGGSADAGAALAGAGNTIAIWNMSEPSGSRTMHDSSGNRHDGRIGREVTAMTAGGYSGFHFDRLDPDTPPTHPEHVVTVPDSDSLDPGSRDYAIEMRLRTRYQFGNIVQKGQATVPGGSFKLQIPSGHVQCWFRGSSGSVLVTAPNPINDGAWHVVRCDRTADGVALAIDGHTVVSRAGSTGGVSNSWPLSIGGKTACDQVTVGCDYFPGDIDYVRLEASRPTWNHHWTVAPNAGHHDQGQGDHQDWDDLNWNGPSWDGPDWDGPDWGGFDW